jgi:predicted ATPase
MANAALCDANRSSKPGRPIRVLFTGGPGAGKSSAIATLRDRLSKRGFQVVVVPECATVLLTNSDGFDPAWKGTDAFVELQRIFLQYQLDHEKAHEAVARLSTKQAVMLYDRGALDGRLFTTDAEWAAVLKGVGVTEQELLSRYDLVLHVTSCAEGLPDLYDFGPGSSNPARYHTPDQAKEADQLTQKLYEKHPQVRCIPNFTSFDDKIACVLGILEDALRVDGLAGKRCRVELENDLLFEKLRAAAAGQGPKSTELSSWVPAELNIYREDITHCAGLHESLRRRTSLSSAKEHQLFEVRVQNYPQNETIPPYKTRRVLTAAAFEMLLAQAQNQGTVAGKIQKDAACFMWEGKYFELIRYTNLEYGMKRVVLDYEHDTAIPQWVLPQVLEADRVGPLKRHKTADILDVPLVAGSGGRRPSSFLTMIEECSDISRAAAVVEPPTLLLDSPAAAPAESPPAKRQRTTEGKGTLRASDVERELLQDGACMLCCENSVIGLGASGCTCSR